MELFAMIQDGLVVNTVMANSEDEQDPAYLWVDISEVSPTPGVGWSYDGTDFIPPPVPPTDWASMLQEDINNLQSAYSVALSNYMDAVADGHTAAASEGVDVGVFDISSSWTTHEEASMMSLINLIKTGG